MHVQVGARLRSDYSNKVGTVEKINEKWDWFKMRWDKPISRERVIFTLSTAGNNFSRVRSETENIERADEFLRRANGGLDDSWREYD